MLVFLVTWFLSAVCLYVTAAIVPGFKINSLWSSMWAVVVIGFFNMWLRPILLFFAFPVNFLTLGLFTFVVNACILKLSAKLMKSFDIEGWMPAILGAIVLAIMHYFIFSFMGSEISFRYEG
jgi:putative membrane protein